MNELSNIVIFDKKILTQLSYKTMLDKSLKNTLHKFEKDQLINDLKNARRFFLSKQNIIESYIRSYRIKSIDSILMKYDRYYPNTSFERVYNDILGFRILCKNYSDIERILDPEIFSRKSDMRNGKKIDDGYRGLHVYFQESHFHYPIEFQINKVDDRVFNNWLHIHLYKRNISGSIGGKLRKMYNDGKISDENDFRRELNVLLSSEEKK